MATLRLRALRGLSLARGLLLPSAGTGVLLAGLGFRMEAWIVASLPTLAALLALALRMRGDPQAAARCLDSHHNLHGLLQSGLAFAQRPRDELTPFERACLDQAIAGSRGLAVREAIPLRRPLLEVLAGVLVAYAALAFVPANLEPASPTTATSAPAESASSELDDAAVPSPLAAELARLQAKLPQARDGGLTPIQKEIEALAAAAAMADQADMPRVLDRMDLLSARTREASRAPEVAAFAQELSAIAELAQLGEALQAGSPAQVQAAMAALSQQLQQASPAQRARLGRELRTLREHLAQARQETSLLHRPRPEAQADLEQAEAALERTLESLESRGKDPGEALASLGRSLERLARHARDAQAEREAGRALQQLSERTRRGDAPPDGPGSEPRQGQGQERTQEERLSGFLRPTRDGDGTSGSEAAEQAADGPRMAAPDDAQHKPGQGPGAPLLGESAGAVESQGSPSRVRANSSDGPSRSQVIAEVSARGVRSPGYRKVHGDYAAHAMQQMEQSPLSPSDRYVVRRYFDLIAPKERP